MPRSATLRIAEIAAMLVAAVATSHAADLTPVAGASSDPPAPWHVVGLPIAGKPLTRFRVEHLVGVTWSGSRLYFATTVVVPAFVVVGVRSLLCRDSRHAGLSSKR